MVERRPLLTEVKKRQSVTKTKGLCEMQFWKFSLL
jgi:hypothetical protein